MDKFKVFLEARVRVLEHIVEGGEITETLDILCRDTEEIDPVMRCSVLFFDRDNNCLRHAAAPKLPDFYVDAIDGLEVGIGVGSCGTAVFTGERVIVEDVFSHPYWEPYRDLAREVGFKACWSQPILSKHKTVLGTFAMYYDEVRRPTEEELHLIEAQATLASVAIERVEAEKALAQSEQRLRGAIESMREGFVLFDADDRIVMLNDVYRAINPRAQEYLERGLRFEDLVRANYERGWILNATDDEEAFIRDRIEKHRNPGPPITRQFADGKWYILKETVTPEGGIALTVDEVTELIETKNAVDRALTEAEHANRVKSEFLATMSHELRTPLNAIIGFSEVMTSEMFGAHGHEKYRDYAQDIQKSSHHLLTLINDILDLSKVEAGETDYNPEVFSIDATLDECAKLVGFSEDTNPGRIKIDVARKTRDLCADIRIFRQVIINVLSNANKFTPEDGEIRVTTKTAEDGGTIITIADTGVGVAPEDIERVLQPFGQARADIKRTHQGTGLGLPLSKRLMELHGGSLEMESELDVGTTVRLTFPPIVTPHTEISRTA